MSRPSKAKQVDMSEKLLPYFEQHHSALYTAELTGINRNTVNAYFKTFSQLLMDDINQNFVMRQKIRKEQVITLLERDLAELDEHLAEVKMALNAANGMESGNASLHGVRLSIVTARSNIKQQIADIDMTPTLDLTVEDILEKRLHAEYSGEETKGT